MLHRQFLIQGGIGWTTAWWWEEGWDETGGEASGLGLRLGVAYEKKIWSHFVIKPAYEWNLGFNDKSGFSGINLNLGWK